MSEAFGKITGKHGCAALRWFESMRTADQWGLSVEEQLALLGGVEPSTFSEWMHHALLGNPVELPLDCLERLSLFLGIYKRLKLLAPSDRSSTAVKWFTTSNPTHPFNGQSPKEYAITNHTIDSLYLIKQYLDKGQFFLL